MRTGYITGAVMCVWHRLCENLENHTKRVTVFKNNEILVLF